MGAGGTVAIGMHGVTGYFNVTWTHLLQDGSSEDIFCGQVSLGSDGLWHSDILPDGTPGFDTLDMAADALAENHIGNPDGTCGTCGSLDSTGVEYGHDSQRPGVGVSEWLCNHCGQMRPITAGIPAGDCGRTTQPGDATGQGGIQRFAVVPAMHPPLAYRVAGPGFASWLIATDAALFLVDTGFRWTHGLVLRAIRRIGRDPSELRLVILTHPHADHSTGLPGLLSHSAPDVMAHPSAVISLAAGGYGSSVPRTPWAMVVSWMERKLLSRLRLTPIVPTVIPLDGERLDRFGLAATVMFTPGHSESDLSLLLDDGTAVTGDLFRGGELWMPPSPADFAENPALALSGIRRLLDAGARRFLPGHGHPATDSEMRALLARQPERATTAV